jgi:hypothetical protein
MGRAGDRKTLAGHDFTDRSIAWDCSFPLLVVGRMALKG